MFLSRDYAGALLSDVCELVPRFEKVAPAPVTGVTVSRYRQLLSKNLSAWTEYILLFSISDQIENCIAQSVGLSQERCCRLG